MKPRRPLPAGTDQLEVLDHARVLAEEFLLGRDEARPALIALGGTAVEPLTSAPQATRERARSVLFELGDRVRFELEQAKDRGSTLAAEVLRSLSERAATVTNAPSHLGGTVEAIAALSADAAVPALVAAAQDPKLRGLALRALRDLDGDAARASLAEVEARIQRELLDAKRLPDAGASVARALADPAAFRSTFRPRGRFGALLAALGTREESDGTRDVLLAYVQARYGRAWYRGHGPFDVDDEHDSELVLSTPRPPSPDLGFVRVRPGQFELSVEKRDPGLVGEWLEVGAFFECLLRIVSPRSETAETLVVVASSALAASFGLEPLDEHVAIGWISRDASSRGSGQASIP
ncbi:MAG: hypothetical protein HYV07_15410 [Deltaproteobacteria bacterium]|nr:hypothetical protein [Deltaproteobacteria bacterium]